MDFMRNRKFCNANAERMPSPYSEKLVVNRSKRLSVYGSRKSSERSADEINWQLIKGAGRKFLLSVGSQRSTSKQILGKYINKESLPYIEKQKDAKYSSYKNINSCKKPILAKAKSIRLNDIPIRKKSTIHKELKNSKIDSLNSTNIELFYHPILPSQSIHESTTLANKYRLSESKYQRHEEQTDKLNKTDLLDIDYIQTPFNHENKNANADSLANLEFVENEKPQPRNQNVSLLNHISDEIKPLFFFNAKAKKEDVGENSYDSKIETPCFKDHLSREQSKKALQLYIDSDINQQQYLTAMHNISKLSHRKSKLSGRKVSGSCEGRRRLNIVIKNSPIESMIVKMISIDQSQANE